MSTAVASLARARSYPARPITIIVRLPTSDATDTLARILSERLRASLYRPPLGG
jgi:tripartite-type tricarboxylate transporter receptor subunit TctC